ncbi:hypothetical protein ACWDUN_20690 [Mycobacterium sp. NPDC003323]
MTSEPVPPEVPVADAVEQSRDATEQVPDEEAATTAGSSLDSPPLEAPAADWQEQSIDAGTGLDDDER